MLDSITRLNAGLEGCYRVDREIGEGGMATVYLADDLKHERKVALKVLKPELAAVMGAERFLAEIKTTANLQHPHILPLYDSGEADGFLYYVMPYIEGETLADRLTREKQLPVEEAVTIASDVAEALHAAHEQGVIHRDVKPANILMSSGRPLVADFGIALAVSAAGGGRLTETGLSMGTPYYMSPEQATADREPSPASDVYSLGCVLYEMLVGDPPHTGSSAQAVLAKILTEEAPDATKTRASIPANVDAAIRKSLQKLPADRFTDAQGLTKALADAGFRYGELAAVGAGTQAGHWKSISMALAGTTLALAALAGWLVLQPGPRAVVSQYRIELPPDQDFRPTGRGRNIALDPNGEWFVYRGSGTLFLQRHDQLQATPLEGTDGDGDLAVNPDGSKVALASSMEGHQLMVATIGGGPPIPVATLEVRGGAGSRSGISWGHDGYIYYDGGPEGPGISRVPEDGGTPELLTTPDTEVGEQSHTAPHALPNGRGVLFEVLHPDGTRDVAAHDLQAGVHTTLVPDARRPLYSTTGHLIYVSEVGTLIAVPFDQDALTITGNAVAIVEGVQIGGNAAKTDLELGADGTLMFVAREGEAELQELVWVTRDGAARPIDPELPRDHYGDPALSPDGRQLAVTVTGDGRSEIWVKQLPEGRFSLFTEDGGERAAWSSDGQALAFWSNRDGTFRIYVRRSDGSAPPELVSGFDPTLRPGEIVFSRDGEWMVVESGEDIYAVRLDSAGAPEGEVLEIRTSENLEVQPALSPDGRWLAYMGSGDWGFAVIVCPFPRCDVFHRVATGGSGPTLPIWSHDGRELLYRNGASSIVAVDVLPGTTFDWGEERTLFSLRGFAGAWPQPWDLAADDQRFVMRRVQRNPAQLIVVRNFSELLEERVPN